MKRPLAVAATLFSAAALLMSGCGSDSLSTAGPSGEATGEAEIPAVEASLELHDSLPDAIKDAGVIEVGAEATYKPNEYLDGTTVVGMNPELFDAVAMRLGVENNWNMAAFDSILAGVQAGKYDVGSSSFTITEERMETLTFVEYLNVGSQWATLVDNPGEFDQNDPCGATVAYQTGTTQEVEIKELQETTCASDPMEELAYTGQDEVNNALMIGKADAMTADYPIVQNAIQSAGGEMAALGEQYGPAPYGFTMAKDNQQLAEAISKALADLAESGVYGAILDKYGVSDAAVDQFPIDPELA